MQKPYRKGIMVSTHKNFIGDIGYTNLQSTYQQCAMLHIDYLTFNMKFFITWSLCIVVVNSQFLSIKNLIRWKI